MRKLILAATAAATLAGGLAATATPAAAQPYWGYHHRVYRPYRAWAPPPYYAPVYYGYGYRPYPGYYGYGHRRWHRW